MKSLFSNKDINISEKLPNGFNDQKRLKKIKIESVIKLLKDKNDCTLSSITLPQANGNFMVFYTESLVSLFRKFDDKSIKELVDEIYEDMITRKLMGDF